MKDNMLYFSKNDGVYDSILRIGRRSMRNYVFAAILVLVLKGVSPAYALAPGEVTENSLLADGATVEGSSSNLLWNGAIYYPQADGGYSTTQPGNISITEPQPSPVIVITPGPGPTPGTLVSVADPTADYYLTQTSYKLSCPLFSNAPTVDNCRKMYTSP
jgi:hypothetical protein